MDKPFSNLFQSPTPQTDFDKLMGKISTSLYGDKPPGTYYQPGQSSPDSSAGGHVPSIRRYKIIVDKILVPNNGSLPATAKEYLEGNVTEADLIAAGCHIPFLLDRGHIIPDGYTRA